LVVGGLSKTGFNALCAERFFFGVALASIFFVVLCTLAGHKGGKGVEGGEEMPRKLL
jgi:hypothetical protein